MIGSGAENFEFTYMKKIRVFKVYAGIDKAILLHHLGNRDVNRNLLLFIGFVVVEEGRQ